MTKIDLIIASSPIERREKIKIKVPKTKTEFRQLDLKSKTEKQLIKLGLRKWNEKTNLFLFPGEWFNIIPEGYNVVSISGKFQKFSKHTSDDDTRFGCLPYGIIPNKK